MNSPTEGWAPDTDYLGRYTPGSGLLRRLPVGPRWLLALGLSVAVLAVRDPIAVVALSLAAAGLYAGAGLPVRTLLRDLRPLTLQVPLVLAVYLVQRGAGALGEGLQVAVQIMVALLPALWLQRVTPMAELLAAAQRVLPRRLALVLMLALRFLPELSREFRSILLVQRLRGQPLDRASLRRPRRWPEAARALGVPAVVRSARLAEEVSLAVRARGIGPHSAPRRGGRVG